MSRALGSLILWYLYSHLDVFFQRVKSEIVVLRAQTQQAMAFSWADSLTVHPSWEPMTIQIYTTVCNGSNSLWPVSSELIYPGNFTRKMTQ